MGITVMLVICNIAGFIVLSAVLVAKVRTNREFKARMDYALDRAKEHQNRANQHRAREANLALRLRVTAERLAKSRTKIKVAEPNDPDVREAMGIGSGVA